MPKKSTFFNAIKREINNTYTVIEIARTAAEVSDAMRGDPPVAGIKGLLASALRELKRSVRLGLLFGALLSLKLMLIVAFNVAAVLLFVWLLFAT